MGIYSGNYGEILMANKRHYKGSHRSHGETVEELRELLGTLRATVA